jgi:hypothetical protein
MPWILRQREDIKIQRPTRVRLDSGMTLTGEEVTDQILTDTGWRWEDWPEPEPYWQTTATTTSTSETDVIEP